MKTTNPTAAHTPDTGDLATDAIADAGYWKREARKARAIKADLLAALEMLHNAGEHHMHAHPTDCDWAESNARFYHALDEARAAIARAKGVQS